ncbi:MAG TPA: hypothetical protein VHH11_13985 [Gammaproteobacteria bacterium]|nr:hypothetical protein [Gammaproteobacteria bacterium]
MTPRDRASLAALRLVPVAYPHAAGDDETGWRAWITTPTTILADASGATEAAAYIALADALEERARGDGARVNEARVKGAIVVAHHECLGAPARQCPSCGSHVAQSSLELRRPRPEVPA